MVEKKRIADAHVRNGIASLPEMEDLSLEVPVTKTSTEDNGLDGALPEGDAPASGRLD
ncbi:hypothetical protein [Rhizobium sp. SG570]|uniref:hypothetical protein n=1 Tax=Rhizobium sp. SG570 TaxID=2587113 RepID=UPI0014487237|nr:hypothetical protein [Rhizobium sp. SG570]NKJ36530.1 hypothetical protein [Rhizobium sp. SG570]NRP90065.1 hypothetical protein [Ensifer adhaerens]